MEKKDVIIRKFINAIVAKYDNKRLIITPTKDGIIYLFKRLLTQEEKEKEFNTPNQVKEGNKLLVTSLYLSEETSYILAQVLLECRKDIKIRQIVNDVVKKDARQEAIEILDHCTDQEMGEMVFYYEKQGGNIVCLHLDSIKRRLVLDGIMEQTEQDHFGYQLI